MFLLVVLKFWILVLMTLKYLNKVFIFILKGIYDFNWFKFQIKYEFNHLPAIVSSLVLCRLIITHKCTSYIFLSVGDLTSAMLVIKRWNIYLIIAINDYIPPLLGYKWKEIVVLFHCLGLSSSNNNVGIHKLMPKIWKHGDIAKKMYGRSTNTSSYYRL